MPRQLAQQQADKVQRGYDSVLNDGQGKTVKEVEILLAQHWHASLSGDLDEPALSENAEHLAAGRRIKVKLPRGGCVRFAGLGDSLEHDVELGEEHVAQYMQ
jgi:hypothetical protein